MGIGDDAAVLAAIAKPIVTTDTMTEAVHFESDWLSARAIGVRAFRVAFSDIAAMGASPKFALLSLGMVPGYSLSKARGMLKGFLGECADCRVSLVGGNLSSSTALSITVTAIGEGGRRTPLRSGARAGHAVYVTGTLGDAAAGVEFLRTGRRRGRFVDAYRSPPRNLELGRALARASGLGAMIDLSDGLVQDLEQICKASVLSARLDLCRVPLSAALRRSASSGGALEAGALDYALRGGDDYELLFTGRPTRGFRTAVARLAQKYRTPITAIGIMEEADPFPHVIDWSGRRLCGGFRHFEEAP